MFGIQPNVDTFLKHSRTPSFSVLPRHDEFGSKVSKFNQEADKICEVTAVEFLNNTKLLADIENYVYKSDPTECVKLTEQEQGIQINIFDRSFQKLTPENETEIFRVSLQNRGLIR